MGSTTTTARLQNGVGGSNDDRSEYALVVQQKSKKLAEDIRASSIVNRATWANPLATAPSAVCTMAILLKTSSSPVAAGVKVNSRLVRDPAGKERELPHDLLWANLEHCSNLGRDAFNEARSTMHYINRIAVRMVEDNGKLENILSAIEEGDDEDEEDDYMALADDIKDVRDGTADSLEKIINLTGSFQYWHRVIECLKENVVNCQGETKDKANQNDQSKKSKEAETQKLADNGQSRAGNIAELQLQLEDAKRRVSEASAHVKDLEGVLPVMGEFNPEEEQLLAEKAIPLEWKKKGLLGKIKEKIAGESNEAYLARMEHQRDVERRRTELINQKREQRESQKRGADRLLAAARSHEKSLNNQLTKLIADVGKNKDMLASATANLTRAAAQFQRLSEEGLELRDILEILNESGHQLGELRKQVQDLVTFFGDILNEVKVTVEGDVQKDLLRPIDNKLTYDKNGVCNGINMKTKAKKRVHDSATKIQGRFCAIRDITDVYVLVSDRYITPAINQMGDLAGAKNDEWPVKRDEFTRWCHHSMGEIQALTKATDDNMVSHMTERLQHLRLAIEPAH